MRHNAGHSTTNAYLTKCQKRESSSAVYFERLRVSKIKCFGCFKSKQLHFHLSKKKEGENRKQRKK